MRPSCMTARIFYFVAAIAMHLNARSLELLDCLLKRHARNRAHIDGSACADMVAFWISAA